MSFCVDPGIVSKSLTYKTDRIEPLAVIGFQFLVLGLTLRLRAFRQQPITNHQ